jgi:regulator of ribonuclease activity A
MTFKTADLYDEHGEDLQVATPLFKDFGQRRAFSGPIATVKCFEDNSLVRKSLGQPGDGRVLVVDGGGSVRCALVGDRLAALGRDNGWAGIVVFGCIRDSEELATIDIGIKALGTNPRKSVKREEGQSQIPLRFADVRFEPGSFLYADPDGIVISASKLHYDVQ